MTNWSNHTGKHERLSDEQLKKDLRDLRGVEKLLRHGKISHNLFVQALNILRPEEGPEQALGDRVNARDGRQDYRGTVTKKRGRKSFEDLGEGIG